MIRARAGSGTCYHPRPPTPSGRGFAPCVASLSLHRIVRVTAALAHYAFIWRKRILLCALAVGVVAAYGASSLFDAVKPYGFQDPDSESSRAYEALEDATGERPLPEV